MNQMPEKLKEIKQKNADEWWHQINKGVPISVHATSVYRIGFDSCYQHLAPLIQEMREALEFYGDQNNYTHFPATSDPDCIATVGFIEEQETGNRARQALEKVKEVLE